MRAGASVLGLVAALSLVSPAGAATLRLFSYDPATAETRHAAGAVTLELRQHLVFTTVMRVLSTQGQAGADLRAVGDGALGRGGLAAVIGPKAGARDLYEVQPTHEGPAMIAALCPGSTRGWMAMGHVRAEQNLRIFVLGDAPQGAGTPGRARLCQTLDFSWHGEWRVPATSSYDQRLGEQPHFPR